MRDHTRLRAFALADQLAIATYRETATFPIEERFGLQSQMRRAAVSIATNIVEGCARSTQSEYARFVEIAYSSTRELEYEINISARLGYLSRSTVDSLAPLCVETGKCLNGLLRSLRNDRQDTAESRRK